MSQGVIVVSSAADPHAAALLWALKRKGISTARLSLDDASDSLDCSLRFGEPVDVHHVKVGGTSIPAGPYGCVWFRRIGIPRPPEDVHPADWKMAHASWRTLMLALPRLWEADGTLAVNAPAGSLAARNKPFQLDQAIRAGLSIPKTLVSNVEADIIGFLRENEQRGLRSIIKGLTPFVWVATDGTQVPFTTSVVTENMVLQSDVGSAPHIYQTLIEKEIEVRVIVCGRSMLACELKANEKLVDIRRESDWNKMNCKPIEIPSAIQRPILKLFNRLGIIFGSVDFIINKNGEWIFLEVNDQGNFLWMEELNPTLPILDMVADFLANGQKEFIYRPTGRVKLSDFKFTALDRPVVSSDRFIGYEQ